MSALPEPDNFVDHCRELARSRAERTAYVWLEGGRTESARWSFLELDRQARKVAAHLAERNLRGERALLLFAPGLEFVAAFLGCLYAGVVAVPLSPPRKPTAAAGVLGIARHAEPRALLTDAAMFEGLIARGGLFESLEVIVTDRLDADEARWWRPAKTQSGSLAFLQYTSGSTGAPKGVEISHANLIRNEQMVRTAFENDQDTVFVSWLPMFHDMGLVGNVLQPLFLGVPCVLMSPSAFVQKPVRWLRALSDYGGTVSGGPNFGYEMCNTRVQDSELEGLDLSRWRVAYNGAEPIRGATLEAFAERFAAVGFRRDALYPCYGMAEASLFVTGGRASDPYRVLDVDGRELEENRVMPVEHEHPHRQTLVGCGRPWLDQELEIVDPRTSVPVSAGEVGEIWLRGGNLARGYRGQLEGEPDPFQGRLATGEGPWLRTGDLGFERDGQLFVTGRIKDVLIQNGRNYYPQDLELCAARSHPSLRVDHAAAFTVDDDGHERVVLALEIDREQADALASDTDGSLGEEIAAAVRKALAASFAIQTWSVLLVAPGSLPRTSSGKLQRRSCSRLWRAGKLALLRDANAHTKAPEGVR